MARKKFHLRIYHDHLTEGEEAVLPATRRVIYCVSGDAALSAAGRSETLANDQA